MVRYTQIVFVCTSFGLLAGCGQSWPPVHEAVESHFAEHHRGMQKLATAFEESGYLFVQMYEGGDIFVEEYPGGRAHSRRLRGTEARQWKRLLYNARVPKVHVDELDIVNMVFIDKRGSVDLDLSYIIPGDGDRVWRTSYRLRPGHLYPAPVCSSDHGDAPCGRCKVNIDESWTVFYEWMPASLDRALFRELISDDRTIAESKTRWETVFTACSASKGRTFELPESN